MKSTQVPHNCTFYFPPLQMCKQDSPCLKSANIWPNLNFHAPVSNLFKKASFSIRRDLFKNPKFSHSHTDTRTHSIGVAPLSAHVGFKTKQKNLSHCAHKQIQNHTRSRCSIFPVRSLPLSLALETFSYYRPLFSLFLWAAPPLNLPPTNSKWSYIINQFLYVSSQSQKW